MFLWNYKKLALELRESKLSERDKFYYCLVFTLLSLFSVYLMSYMSAIKSTAIKTGQDIFFIKIIFDAAFVFLYIAGLFWWYKTNSKGDNKNFIERTIVLSVPLTIRVFLLVFALSFFVSSVITLVILHYSLDIHTSIYIMTPALGSATLIGNIWYIGRMKQAISIASQGKI
jgi:hypothetical protein